MSNLIFIRLIDIPSRNDLILSVSFFQTILKALCMIMLVTPMIMAKDVEPVKMSLISEQAKIIPGQLLRLGVYQDIAEGFHTYYKNPGKVGLPTNIKWTLPEGFEAGPILWPTPQETTMSAYTVWGYENSALLLTKITVPKNINPDKTYELKARVTYMCCSDTCHPGASNLSITLKVGTQQHYFKEWKEKFDQVEQQQAMTSNLWKSSCIKTNENYILSLNYRENLKIPKLENIKIYTDERIIDSNIPIISKKTHKGYQFTAKIEKFVGTPPDQFSAILVSDSNFERDKSVIKVLCNIE